MSAANNPTIAELSALVATLQQEIATLRQQQAQQPVAPAANPVVFGIHILRTVVLDYGELLAHWFI
jgi:hypothetical protein